MKHFKVILFLLLFFSLRVSAQQNTYPVLDMQTACTPVANFMTADSIPVFSDSTIYAAQMQITLEDTVNISSIEVKFGKSSNDLLLQKTFVFDASGTDGTSYLRNGYNVVLGLGNAFQDVGSFYAEMKIKRSDDSFSQVFTFLK